MVVKKKNMVKHKEPVVKKKTTTERKKKKASVKTKKHFVKKEKKTTATKTRVVTSKKSTSAATVLHASGIKKVFKDKIYRTSTKSIEKEPTTKTKSSTAVANGEDHVLHGLLDQLAPLTAQTANYLVMIRRLAHRINSRVNNSEKHVKARSLYMLRKTKSECIVDIVKLLERTKDKSTCISLAAIIHACVAPKSGRTRKSVLKQLVKLEATKIFMKLVMNVQSKSVGSPDLLITELIFILGPLSQKDRKFAKHAEALNAAKTFHFHLKNNIKNVKLITPLLMCFKTLTKNETISGILLKDKFLLTLGKLLKGKRKYIKKNKQLVFLVLLANVTKKITEDNCERFVRGGLMQYVLDVFDMKLHSAKKSYPKILSTALDTLVHISNTNNGRMALRKSNKINTFSARCPDEQVYNSTLSKLCTVINICQEKSVLPLNSIQSAFTSGLNNMKTDDCDLENFVGTDSNDSESDDNKTLIVQNSVEQLQIHNLDIQKSKSIQLDVPFSPWKDSDELVSMYGRMFEENDHEISKNNVAKNPGMGRKVDSIGSFTKFKSSKNFFTVNTSILNDSSDKNDLRLLANLRKSQTHKAAYSNIAKRVKSVAPFVKIAYPDWIGADSVDQSMESLYNIDVHVSRTKLLSCLDRVDSKRKAAVNLTVYDLDYLVKNFGEFSNPLQLTNDDERNLGTKLGFDHLHFESRFESGNLRKAIKVGIYEYDLILNSDVNSLSHNQWFYFQVSNMEALKPYIFNIINMEKNSSQYKNGMQPIMFSVKRYTELKRGWRRVGTDICYFKNYYKNFNKQNSTYMTASFTIQFPFQRDICYIAYVYPYTYSTLLYKCFSWKNSVNPSTTLFRTNCLCRTLNDNEVPIITITSVDTNENKIKDRPIVYLTSRVHPGETNSSWVIDGVIEFLCGDTITAKKVLENYMFKIIPMLNVEGVINGCHRCGLTNEDLNRKWSAPDPKLHPEIFHARGILEYMAKVLNTVPHVYCDFHGHSNQKNCFFYGCSAKKSWSKMDLAKYENKTDFMALPNLMHNYCPSFSLSQCSFKIEKNRETTARITVWRSYGVKRSYTLETSYCGCDEGVYKGFHFGIKTLKEIGSTFCLSLSLLEEETKKRMDIHASNQLSSITPSSSSRSIELVEEEQSDSD